MENNHEFKTAFCTRYEEMLVDSKEALEAWTKRREAVWDLGLRGKDYGGELIRLQANFAGAYARLEKHSRECVLCSFVKNLSKQNNKPYRESRIA
jgi:hypothetical protein